MIPRASVPMHFPVVVVISGGVFGGRLVNSPTASGYNLVRAAKLRYNLLSESQYLQGAVRAGIICGILRVSHS